MDIDGLGEHSTITVAELAAVTRLAVWRIRKLMKAGQAPPHFKAGMTYRFPVAGVRRWMGDRAGGASTSTDAPPADWQTALRRMLAKHSPEVEAVHVDAPYVYLITGTTGTRYWVPETLGPVSDGPVVFRPVPQSPPTSGA